MGLRLGALAARSSQTIVLARFLSVEDVGRYGLIVVTVGYLIYPLGFDFYTYSTRELLRGERERWPTFLRSHAAFAAVLYALALALIVVPLITGQLAWSGVAWLLLLVPSEHLGMEIERVLIATGRQLQASVTIFVRQGLMPLTAVPLVALSPDLRTLSTVLSCWLGCNLVGAALGAGFVRRELRGAGRARVDWPWIRRGMRIAAPLLAGTLCLRALATLDRHLLKVWAGLDVVAAYSVFMAIAAGMSSIVYAGVHQFAYPRLVRHAARRDPRGLRREARRMLAQTLVVVLATCGAVAVLMPFALGFIGHATYARQIWMLPWVLGATAIFNLSLVPHYVLYALDGDRVILASAALGLAVFVGLATALDRGLGVEGARAVCIALASSYVLLAAAKSVAAARRSGRWRDSIRSHEGAAA
ncbi:lipopolysaccharide biosynthesis protein [Nocardioides nitrophenolicus]|uniref:lipopolysaccharide biosynthesis protein n=1 Tax=Nocardioides nitrophenolicus TaxID=60489 RepID=UPI00195E3F2F|nr:oligosaccharide flippase family protein [Nocardioides nitrophenolicus]MBM7518711.1 O-antigen/teichoic acid export membrane protein [Nocardioides nitrophenolicus]